VGEGSSRIFDEKLDHGKGIDFNIPYEESENEEDDKGQFQDTGEGSKYSFDLNQPCNDD